MCWIRSVLPKKEKCRLCLNIVVSVQSHSHARSTKSASNVGVHELTYLSLFLISAFYNYKEILVMLMNLTPSFIITYTQPN